MKKLFVLLLCLNILSALEESIFLKGDNFRNFCDHAIFEDGNVLNQAVVRNLNPAVVKEGDTVFVPTQLLKTFLNEVHPLITHPYILVSHGDDDPIPDEHDLFLSDNKIIAWFGQNVQKASHPKLHPLPIGIPNQRWWCGNSEAFIKKLSEPPKERTIELYMNFTINTNRAERKYVYDHFKNNPLCFVELGKTQAEYLDHLLISKFVLSPRGHGLDCHRTWESLLMGAIPIVKTSDLDPLFENLPVLIVPTWKVVTQRFLAKKYIEMQKRTYQMEKIFCPYWLQQIESVKQSYLSKKQ